MHGKRAVDAELKRSLELSIRKLKPVLAAGGDPAERKFMECCWSLWKADGAELVEPFVDAAFNALPERSRAVLFQRMLTIVYVAQEIELRNATEPVALKEPKKKRRRPAVAARKPRKPARTRPRGT